MKSWKWTVVVATVVLGTSGACSEDKDGDGTGGAGGTGTGTTSSSGNGGAGGAGTGCHGDPDAWDGIEKMHIACSKNSDCCVVVSSCTQASQVVHADDFVEAQTVYPWCDDECTFCIAEYVEVACVSGECVGYPEPEGTIEPKEGVSQCGADAVDPQLPDPALVFGCQ